MRPDDLFKGLNHLEDTYVLEAMEDRMDLRTRLRKLTKWAAAILLALSAVCVLLIPALPSFRPVTGTAVSEAAEVKRDYRLYCSADGSLSLSISKDENRFLLHCADGNEREGRLETDVFGSVYRLDFEEDNTACLIRFGNDRLLCIGTEEDVSPLLPEGTAFLVKTDDKYLLYDPDHYLHAWREEHYPVQLTDDLSAELILKYGFAGRGINFHVFLVFPEGTDLGRIRRLGISGKVDISLYTPEGETKEKAFSSPQGSGLSICIAGESLTTKVFDDPGPFFGAACDLDRIELELTHKCQDNTFTFRTGVSAVEDTDADEMIRKPEILDLYLPGSDQLVFGDELFLVLRPRKDYRVFAEWKEDSVVKNGFQGTAEYSFRTE